MSHHTAHGSDERLWPPPERTTLINFVLDKSGSMGSIAEATISGFNEFKQSQRDTAGRALFTLTLFDTEIQRRCTALPIERVADLDRTSYQPGGCTALYDAVGSTIFDVDRYLEGHGDGISQVVFVIMTDGLENASREFTHRQVFDMIAERQASHGYEFVYLGANQDSYAVSGDMGVRARRSRNFIASSAGVSEAYACLSAEMSDYRREGTRVRAAWFESAPGQGEASGGTGDRGADASSANGGDASAQDASAAGRS
jgi:hypothetical protein